MPKNKERKLKLIIDTNLWISFIISHKQAQLDHLLLTGKTRLLFSIELLDEVRATMAKPKLRKYLGMNAFDEMAEAFEDFIDIIDVKSNVVVCRDPKDNFLLALAKDGKADYLLTGDKDLLELKKIGKTKISTITTFFDEIESTTKKVK